jgi:hypothetical protein
MPRLASIDPQAPELVEAHADAVTAHLRALTSS